MLWLLQNNFVEGMTGKLAWALKHTSRPMHDFSVTAGQGLPAFPIEPSDPHFFYGSTGMLQQLRATQWGKYLFDNALSLDQRHWQANMGQRLLNASAEFMELDAVKNRVRNYPNSAFFVRPVIAQKAFAGHVVRNGDLSAIFKDRNGQAQAQSGSLLVAVSPLVSNLEAEYRFVVLDGEIRLGSRYREHGEMAVSAKNIPKNIWSAAQELAKGWMPASFVVMDVAVLSNGDLRVIEFNSVHSSGLYQIDCESFAELVEVAKRQQVTESRAYRNL